MFGVARWEDVSKLSFLFKAIVEIPGVDVRKIYPLQQRTVKRVWEAVKDDARIDKMVLFGSSITMCCTEDSDLDFVVKLKDEYLDNRSRNEVSEIIQIASDWNSDILWYDHLSDDDYVFQDAKRGVRII